MGVSVGSKDWLLRCLPDLDPGPSPQCGVDQGLIGRTGCLASRTGPIHVSLKHQLRSLPGDFSGLHVLCIKYVGFKIIDPTVDIGFDIATEYAEACRLSGTS